MKTLKKFSQVTVWVSSEAQFLHSWILSKIVIDLVMRKSRKFCENAKINYFEVENIHIWSLLFSWSPWGRKSEPQIWVSILWKNKKFFKIFRFKCFQILCKAGMKVKILSKAMEFKEIDEWVKVCRYQ